jgi:hypothetical protein
MNRMIGVVALGAACVVQPGQKVRARIIDVTVSCSEPTADDPSTGFVVLPDEGDLFVAEALDLRTDKVLSVPYERDGRNVTFFCLPEMTQFGLKLVEVLNRSEEPYDSDPEVPTPPR